MGYIGDMDVGDVIGYDATLLDLDPGGVAAIVGNWRRPHLGYAHLVERTTV